MNAASYSSECVSPLGARSCYEQRKSEGSLSENSEAPQFAFDSIESYNEIVFAKSTPPARHSWAIGKYHWKISQAEAGKLKFGRGNRYDVDEIVSCPGLLELKFRELPPDCEDTQQWLRVYFVEPTSAPQKMIKLRMALKEAGNPTGQTRDAMRAYDDFRKYLDSTA